MWVCDVWQACFDRASVVCCMIIALSKRGLWCQRTPSFPLLECTEACQVRCVSV